MAQSLSMGTAAHAVGTSKSMEIKPRFWCYVKYRAHCKRYLHCYFNSLHFTSTKYLDNFLKSDSYKGIAFLLQITMRYFSSKRHTKPFRNSSQN